jgi:hypothetical protein
MPLPHPSELAMDQPDGTPFFLVYVPDTEPIPGRMPLMSKEAFQKIREVRLEVDEALGTPWVAGRDANERLFTMPGVYEFTLTEILETEDMPLYKCRVQFESGKK